MKIKKLKLKMMKCTVKPRYIKILEKLSLNGKPNNSDILITDNEICIQCAVLLNWLHRKCTCNPSSDTKVEKLYSRGLNNLWNILVPFLHSISFLAQHALKSWSSCFHFPNAGITGMHHYTYLLLKNSTSRSIPQESGINRRKW